MTDVIRFARWLRRRRAGLAEAAAGRRLPWEIRVGSRVYVTGQLGIEARVVSIAPDRRIVTVEGDDGQAHWADARHVYRLP